MLRKFLGRLRRDKKGQGLVEYALIIGGVALIAAASISVFGHKTTDIISAVAAILPGAHSGDNGTDPERPPDRDRAQRHQRRDRPRRARDPLR